MTIEEAIAKCAADKAMLERAVSDLETALSLYSVDAKDEAVNLYASVQHSLRLHYRT